MWMKREQDVKLSIFPAPCFIERSKALVRLKIE